MSEPATNKELQITLKEAGLRAPKKNGTPRSDSTMKLWIDKEFFDAKDVEVTGTRERPRYRLVASAVPKAERRAEAHWRKARGLAPVVALRRTREPTEDSEDEESEESASEGVSSSEVDEGLRDDTERLRKLGKTLAGTIEDLMIRKGHEDLRTENERLRVASSTLARAIQDFLST